MNFFTIGDSVLVSNWFFALLKWWKSIKKGSGVVWLAFKWLKCKLPATSLLWVAYFKELRGTPVPTHVIIPKILEKPFGVAEARRF